VLSAILKTINQACFDQILGNETILTTLICNLACSWYVIIMVCYTYERREETKELSWENQPTQGVASNVFSMSKMSPNHNVDSRVRIFCGMIDFAIAGK
jgi:hypothetical protein